MGEREQQSGRLARARSKPLTTLTVQGCPHSACGTSGDGSLPLTWAGEEVGRRGCGREGWGGG